MKQFTLFKTNSENYEYIIDVFKMLVGNAIQTRSEENFLILMHPVHQPKEIIDTFKSLQSDLSTSISIYLSYPNEVAGLEEELQLVLPILKSEHFEYLNLKKLLLTTMKLEHPKEFLAFILENTGFQANMIETMAECDLNVSRAATALYMHRNTLIYKLDRLSEMKNFDLRKFKDCYCLYQLIVKM